MRFETLGVLDLDCPPEDAAQSLWPNPGPVSWSGHEKDVSQWANMRSSAAGTQHCGSSACTRSRRVIARMLVSPGASWRSQGWGEEVTDGLGSQRRECCGEQGTWKRDLCRFDHTPGKGATIDRHCGSWDDVACFDENQSVWRPYPASIPAPPSPGGSGMA
jgi:hypothetical protein